MNRTKSGGASDRFPPTGPADVTLHIGPVPADTVKEQVINTIGYSGRVPGPLSGFARALPCGSAVQGNHATECRIRNAIAAVFYVASKPIVESGISGDRHDQVVPAVELAQDH